MAGPELLRPASLAEASAMLLEHGEDALALAGGTALVLLLRQRLLSARYFVDLTALPGLGEVAWNDDSGARIGALATLRDVERSSALRAALPIVPETYAAVGNVRIRNAATVGGNLAHGDYRLDPPAALLVLDARVHIAGPRGPRELPLTEFFRGLEKTALERGELITAVTIAPPPPGAAGAYVKFSSLGADDWPCVGAAALAALDGGDRIAALAVAVTAVNPVPLRLHEAGPLAAGRAAGHGLLREIGALAAARVAPIADIRGSEWYKREVTAAIVTDALERAIARARALRARGPSS
jgi:aerobic carbon-monoxide dehydrogenase medium subunit